MATTTPDNIRTPNPTDPYNLVADLAILASDVQTALNRRANLYFGTAAQRAAFTTAPNGTHWQDTNGSMYEWVRIAGVWRGSRPIGGQLTLTAPSGGGRTSGSVTFPSGMFGSAPTVVVSGNSVVPESHSVSSTATTTTLTIYMYRNNNTATPINWIATPSF